MAPRSKASTETRARILSVALEMFLRQGYNATTMDAIAAATGTSKGTLYWYFDSKEDLLESSLRAFIEETFLEDAASALGEQTSAAAKLRSLTQALVDAEDAAGGVFHLFLEYWASRPERSEQSGLWLKLLVSYEELIAGIIREGIESSEFQEVDADAITWALMASFDGLAAYGLLNPDLDLRRMGTALMDTVLRGLEAED